MRWRCEVEVGALVDLGVAVVAFRLLAAFQLLQVEKLGWREAILVINLVKLSLKELVFVLGADALVGGGYLRGRSTAVDFRTGGVVEGGGKKDTLLAEANVLAGVL